MGHEIGGFLFVIYPVLLFCLLFSSLDVYFHGGSKLDILYISNLVKSLSLTSQSYSTVPYLSSPLPCHLLSWQIAILYLCDFEAIGGGTQAL